MIFFVRMMSECLLMNLETKLAVPKLWLKTSRRGSGSAGGIA